MVRIHSPRPTITSFEEVKSVKQPERQRPRLDRLNDGYVRVNFRRALRKTPSIPAGT